VCENRRLTVRSHQNKRTSTEEQENLNWRSWHEEVVCKNGVRMHKIDISLF
jgi:hypothetical protein